MCFHQSNICTYLTHVLFIPCETHTSSHWWFLAEVWASSHIILIAFSCAFQCCHWSTLLLLALGIPVQHLLCCSILSSICVLAISIFILDVSRIWISSPLTSSDELGKRLQEQTVFAQTHLLCLDDQQMEMLCQNDQFWLIWFTIPFCIECKGNEILLSLWYEWREQNCT